MKPVNIGLLGLGTVGGGTAAVLQGNAAEISRRLGREIRISAVCDLSEEKARQTCPSAAFVKDPFELVAREDVDVVVELFGGTGIAKEAVLKAIENGKHIVTANKKLLAEYGNEIFPLAEKQNVIVQFEAAVAGGIPIIKALREGLAANRIKSIAGIINGTSNFILSEMREKGSAFADVLKEAQALGYAEADPTFDIEGNDAGHKITIMSALAFGTPMNFSACYLEGISKLDSRDIKYAEEFGYRIKLLGITRKTGKGIELRVHPTLIPESRLLANVHGLMHAGAGAGALPTASAVVADVIDIARLIEADTGHRVPHLAFQPAQVQAQTILPMDEITSSYYLRVQAKDEPGTLGQIAALLAKENVSIEALIQKGVIDQTTAEIVILTHSTVEKRIKSAIAGIEALVCVDKPVTMIRMESLHD